MKTEIRLRSAVRNSATIKVLKEEKAQMEITIYEGDDGEPKVTV